MSAARKVFSKNLRRLREDKSYTQEQLAEKLGINARYVQKLEGKTCPNVKIDTIYILAKALGAKASDFFE